jgi:endoglucanase
MKSQLLASFLVATLLPAFSPVAALADDEQVKLAATARFDIVADVNARVLDDGKVVVGNGTMERRNWVAESEVPRGYTISFPVSHRGWQPLAVRFTPIHDGTVTVSLMGPWEQASPGVIYRQEVLWDDLSAEGTVLTDGGFESRQRDSADGWQSSGGTVVEQSADVAAAQGTRYARTWHNQTLSTSFKVVSGKPVTIRLSARAVRPVGLVEMKRLNGHSTPAHLAARRFRRGANLGNGLEAPPGQDWGVHYAPEDLRIMRAQGFDHVRIPAGWHHYTGPAPAFRIRPEFFARVDQLVNAGLRDGLAVLINIHHFDDFTTNPKEQTPKFLAIWRQIAEHYSKAPQELALELLNEPKDAATTEVINPIFAEAIRQIRQIDPKRTLFVGPGKWNSIAELPLLHLPDDDDNLIVTVHNYEPHYFTHQGATWSGPDTKITGILFPGPPPLPLSPDPKLELNKWVVDWINAYNTQPTATNPSSPRAFEGAIEQAREWSEYYGRPIHVGEFGCFNTAEPVSRANYYRAFRESAEKAGLGWAIWDWKAGFHYWNATTNKPEPGMHDALFGTSSSGKIN